MGCGTSESSTPSIALQGWWFQIMEIKRERYLVGLQPAAPPHGINTCLVLWSVSGSVGRPVWSALSSKTPYCLSRCFHVTKFAGFLIWSIFRRGRSVCRLLFFNSGPPPIAQSNGRSVRRSISPTVGLSIGRLAYRLVFRIRDWRQYTPKLRSWLSFEATYSSFHRPWTWPQIF